MEGQEIIIGIVAIALIIKLVLFINLCGNIQDIRDFLVEGKKKSNKK